MFRFRTAIHFLPTLSNSGTLCARYLQRKGQNSRSCILELWLKLKAAGILLTRLRCFSNQQRDTRR